MLNKLRKSNNKGFTIIEVMIVLAIAGLILLIVFLAVPALQRNARNTQRKNDAAAVSAAYANFLSNNGGSTPTGVAIDTSAGTVDFCAGGGTANGAAAGNCTAGVNVETAKVGYYATNAVWINTTGTATVTTAAVGSESTAKVSTATVLIDVGYSCNATNTGVGSKNARSAAILYATEGGSGSATNFGNLNCVEQ